jgi:histidine triad (HIT) family protein
MPDECLFCRIAAGEIPAKRVAESDSCIAFRDIGPQAPTHVLVIPRKHVESLNEVDDASVVAEMAALAKRVARDEGIAESGYRVVINTRELGGQSVMHLHLHLLGGRPMQWPPG